MILARSGSRLWSPDGLIPILFVLTNGVGPTTDALHVAIAVLNGMDYLLTWNCTHIANAAIRGRIEQACRAAGMQAPIICTPEELTEA